MELMRQVNPQNADPRSYAFFMLRSSWLVFCLPIASLLFSCDLCIPYSRFSLEL